MEVMLMWFLGVGSLGALLTLAIAVDTLRNGRLSQTWFTKRERDRARREAERPIPSAEERGRQPVWERVAARVRRAVTRREPARPAAEAEAPDPVTPDAETPVPDVASAAERDVVGAIDRQTDAAARGAASVSALGSLERGDEVAARRRAAQERIAAEAANSMALSVPGHIEDYFDDLDDVDFPAVSGGH